MSHAGGAGGAGFLAGRETGLTLRMRLGALTCGGATVRSGAVVAIVGAGTGVGSIGSTVGVVAAVSACGGGAAAASAEDSPRQRLIQSAGITPTTIATIAANVQATKPFQLAFGHTSSV